MPNRWRLGTKERLQDAEGLQVKAGERSPRGVRELVLRYAGRNPRPTNRAIGEAVKEMFDVELSDRTIGRYCAKARLPTSSLGSSGANDDDRNNVRPGPRPLSMAPFYVGQQFRVWEGGARIIYVRAVSVDPIPSSMGSVIDFGPLPPEQEIVKLATEVLGLRPNELVRFYICVLDDVQVTLEEAAIGGSLPRQGVRQMVDVFTENKYPELESTLFWLYGANRELQIKVRNPTQYPLQRACVDFYGWRIVVEPINKAGGAVVEAITRGWT